MNRIALKNINVAKNSGKAEEILILKIRAVAVLDDKDFKCIVAVIEYIGNFKFACAVTYLTVTDKFSIYPQVKA
jgi:hypothetical protein